MRFEHAGGGTYIDIDAIEINPTPSPEMDVKGNTVSIPDGSSSPSSTNYTDFGSTAVSGAQP